MRNRVLYLSLIMIFVLIAGCLDYRMGAPENSIAESMDYSLNEEKSAPVQRDSISAAPKLQERKVISNAALTIEVDFVQAAINDIVNITIENGGFISSSSISDIGNDKKRGSIIIRVPQGNFYIAIEKIAALGTEKRRQVSGQDVTEEFIDLGARLDNLKKQEIRLQEILKMANTVKDVLEVEHELERVRGEIESLTGRLNFLNQSVEMSTILVTVIEPSPITGEEWGIMDAIRDAVRGFIESVKGIIVFTGFIIPVLIYLGIAVLVAIGIKRKIIPRLKG